MGLESGMWIFKYFYSFVGLMIQHFGNNASTTIAQYEVKEYPLLLVIMKSQAGLEICSVLKGKGP